MLPAVLLVFLASTLGCAAKSPSGGGSGGDAGATESTGGSGGGTSAGSGGSSGSGERTEERTGTWTYGSGSFEESSCGSLESYLESYFSPDDLTRFLITDIAGGQFTFIEKTLNERTSCADEDTFSCQPMVGEYDLSEALKGTDALLGIEIVVTGRFKGDAELSGQFDIQLECEGASCGLLATAARTDFPCEVQMRFSATHPTD